MPDRFERALQRVCVRLTGEGCPPTLAEAIDYALFPAGHRLRPRLCYAVAAALGEDRPALTDAAAVALELLHSASLVQDDLPDFDDSDLRRGRPSVHRRFGSATAILVSDALIVGAFETVALAVASVPYRGSELAVHLARGIGAPRGATAGQAWEQEPGLPMQQYHRAKTAALFEAAAMAGAVAAAGDAGPWRAVGREVGLAYQLADDLTDRHEDAVGANASQNMAPDAVFDQLRAHVWRATGAIPRCQHPDRVRRYIGELARAFEATAPPPAATQRAIAVGSFR